MKQFVCFLPLDSDSDRSSRQQDPEYSKLRIVPLVEELFLSFFGFMQGKFKAIAAYALTQYDVRLDEQRQFMEALEEVCTPSCALNRLN